MKRCIILLTSHSESGETTLKPASLSDAKISSLTTSLNTPTATTVYYSQQLANTATASGSFRTMIVGATYTFSAAADFYPISGSNWSVQVIATSATAPELSFSGLGQIEAVVPLRGKITTETDRF